jgi:glycosyltransferase involved in cell wall biosynthesis
VRVLIVASNISMRMGGESVLPFHYIRELSALGVECHAVAHARVRDELMASEIRDAARFSFIEDAAIEKAIHRLGKRAPQAIRDRVFMSAIAAVTGARLARAARRIAREQKIDVIHQPTPVSPKFPSFLANMPAPVVIGPMNGGMTFPPAFAKEYGQGSLVLVRIGRLLSGVLNLVIRGKIDATTLLVANERTRAALPQVVDRSRVALLPENGVDLALWNVDKTQKPADPTFVFVGRLIWLKGVDLLIKAFEKAPENARLLIIGDGPEKEKLEKLAARSSSASRIEFLGFLPQSEARDVLSKATARALPSLHECAGAVILEAFACRMPAIATDWGGPQEYISPETGILVAPASKEAFVDGLAQAMIDLSSDGNRAARMGEAARAEIVAKFSWRAKAQQMIEIYRAAIEKAAR